MIMGQLDRAVGLERIGVRHPVQITFLAWGYFRASLNSSRELLYVVGRTI